MQNINRIRKATTQDIDAVAEIYAHIHEQEQAGKATIGWLQRPRAGVCRVL